MDSNLSVKEVCIMKYLHYTVGILFTFCLMTALLITSVEAVAYWIPGY